MTIITKSLKIYPAFKDLIPPLSDDEYKGLEESILTQGCRDTIKVWKDTIIDGHNRYAICKKHGIPYDVRPMRFSSRKDAELWIIQNQLGRRNLITAMRIKLALHKEGLLKERARQNRSGIKGAPVHTRKITAKDAQSSEQTVYRFMRIREIGTQELIQKVETGKIKIGTAYHRLVAPHAQILDASSGSCPGSQTGRPPLYPALDVTTRTVECLYSSDTNSDISDPHIKKCVQNSISRLVRMYGFISDKSTLLKYGSETNRIQKKLGVQLKTIEALMALL